MPRRFTVWFLSLVIIVGPMTSAQQVPTATKASSGPINAPIANGGTDKDRGTVLLDGTPIKLRLGRTISSADAKVGESVDFEVLEDVKAGETVVVPKGGTALATVTEAQKKRRMGRGGKLNVNIDYARLTNGDKVALRAVKETQGGGHVGAMTGAIVATSIVFFPAAPFFLFMHGKDITIPKGTEITAYINGDMKLDLAKFQQAGSVPELGAAVPKSAPELTGKVQINTQPAGADLEVDGAFVGNSPSTLSLSAGDHVITVKKAGYKDWERKMKVSGGEISLNPVLEPVQ